MTIASAKSIEELFTGKRRTMQRKLIWNVPKLMNLDYVI